MTTPQDDAAELEALASHPDTDWEVLHWIAENYPDLRPAVAANPGTYQELIDALASLGDPEIDAAIAMRGRHGVNSHRASTDPLAGMYDSTTTLPAYSEQNYEAYQAYEPYPEPAQEQDTGEIRAEEEPQQEEAAEADVSWSHALQPYDPAVAEQAEAAEEPEDAEEGPRPIPPAPHQMYGGYTPSQEPQRRSLVLPIAAGLGVLLALGMVVALMVFLFAGDDEAPVAEDPGQEEPAAPGEESPEGNGEEPGNGETQDELGQAQAAVASLPEDTSCEPGEDGGVIAALLNTGEGQDGFPGDDDATTVQQALSGLQDSCDADHAAMTAGEARGEAADAELLNEISYDWVNRDVGNRGADTVSGFVTPDGNIECDFSDGVTCTVYSHQYTDGCPGGEGTTYSMTVEGAEMDCDNRVEPDQGRETMPYDQLGTDGFIECASLDDRVSCYSALNPVIGFEVSETGHYTYGG